MGNYPLSRREWFGRIAAPTMAAGLVAIDTNANPIAATGDKLSGTRLFNVCDYGAVGDGKTLNTAAIQKAIDACFADKGGIVLIPSGVFFVGNGGAEIECYAAYRGFGKIAGQPQTRRLYSR